MLYCLIKQFAGFNNVMILEGEDITPEHSGIKFISHLTRNTGYHFQLLTSLTQV